MRLFFISEFFVRKWTVAIVEKLVGEAGLESGMKRRVLRDARDWERVR